MNRVRVLMRHLSFPIYYALQRERREKEEAATVQDAKRHWDEMTKYRKRKQRQVKRASQVRGALGTALPAENQEGRVLSVVTPDWSQ